VRAIFFRSRLLLGEAEASTSFMPRFLRPCLKMKLEKPPANLVYFIIFSLQGVAS
jgi:hypothetical protein